VTGGSELVDQPRPADGRGLTRENRLDLVTGAAVLIVCGLAQTWLLLGPQPFDPAYYFELGRAFPISADDYWALRIGLLIPVRAASLVFGASEATLYAVPLAAVLLLAGAVYGTMLVLFRDRLLAAAAACVTVLTPSWLLGSSSIFPDTVATATFSAAFLFLLLGGSRLQDGKGGRARLAYVVAAGLLLGWTYLIREFSVILLPAVVAAVVLLGYSLRRVALLAGAVLAAVSLELLYGLVRFDNPLVRVRTLLAFSESGGRQAVRDRLDGVLDGALVFPRLLLSWQSGWIVLVLLGVFIVGLAVFRDRRLALFAPWAFGFWAIMVVFGLWTRSSGEMILNVTNVRYWYPVFPALVMGAFGTLGVVLERYVTAPRAAQLVPIALAALALAIVVPSVAEFRACAAEDVWRTDPRARWTELRSWLATAEAGRYDVLWSDRHTERIVPAYTSTTFGSTLWHGEVRSAETRRALLLPRRPREGAAFVVNRRFLSRELRMALREWTLVFTTTDGWLAIAAPGSEAGASMRSWWTTEPRRFVGEAGECGFSRFETKP
jgi:hypothetical protein